MLTQETRIILVRHGQTDWNIAGHYQGQSDSSLTNEGLEQARQTGRRLRGEGVAGIVCSDLGRASRTAEILNQFLQLDIRIDPRWRERAFGKMEGLSAAEVEQAFGSDFRERTKRDPDFSPHGIEALSRFQERIGTALDELSHAHLNQTILVVTHGGCLRCAFRHALSLPPASPARFALKNGALNVLRSRGGEWFIDTWGDDVHLRPPTPH